MRLVRQDATFGSDLLAKYRAGGSPEVFAQITRAYGGMVYSVCLKVTGDPADAEDASQAVFLTLAVQCKTGAKITYLGPWLKKVAKRSALDLIRSRSRRTRRETVSAMNRPDFFDSSPGANLENGEIHKIIRDELDQLPAKYRMPLVLHYFGGLSHEDLAKELRCTVSALGVRLHRGRKMLGERLRKRNISLEGAALGAAIAAAVHHVVSSHFTHTTTLAATQINYGASVMATSMPTQVSQLVHHVALSISQARLRAATTVLAIAALSLGGAAELSKHLPLSLRPSIDISISHLIQKLFRAPAPFRLSEAPRPASPVTQVAAVDGESNDLRPWPLAKPTHTVTANAVAPIVPQAPLAIQVQSSASAAANFPTIPIRPVAVEVQPSAPPTAVVAEVPARKNTAAVAAPSSGGGEDDKKNANDTVATVAPADSGGTAIGFFNASGGGSGGSTYIASAIPSHSLGDVSPSAMGYASDPGSLTSVAGAQRGVQSSEPSGAVASSSDPATVQSQNLGASLSLLSGSISVHKGDGAYVWSDATHGILPGQINSVKFSLDDAQMDGVIRILSLPLDTTLAPTRPSGHHFVNIWSFESSVAFDSISLQVFYDNLLSDEMGLHEERLKLWYYDHDQWIRITDASFMRDLEHHTLSGTTAELQFFAVSAPEPAGIFGGLIAGGFALLRRRRRA